MVKHFLALIAAAAVVIGYLRAEARLDAWRAAVAAEGAAIEECAAKVEKEMWPECDDWALKAEGHWVAVGSLLRQKPFGFRLTGREAENLATADAVAAEIPKRAEARKQRHEKFLAALQAPLPSEIPQYDRYGKPLRGSEPAPEVEAPPVKVAPRATPSPREIARQIEERYRAR